MTVAESLERALRNYQSGRLVEAQALCRAALQEEADHPDALHLLGVILLASGDSAGAEDFLGRAAALLPEAAEFRGHYASALAAQGKLDEAIEAFAEAIALGPELPDLPYNMGNALVRAGRLEEAVKAFDRALAIKPSYAQARNNLATTLAKLGNTKRAILEFEQALKLLPQDPGISFNLGLALLTVGQFSAGWRHHESRLKKKEFQRPDITQPMWDGSDLAGRRILIHSEQGLGDTIQFIRYLPLVKERGGRIVLQCPSGLEPLLARLAGVWQCIRAGDALPGYDVHCPLLSLPHIFRTTLENIPKTVPYLFAEEAAALSWKERLTHRAGLKVGLVWAGGSAQANDENRSATLADFAALARVPGVTYFSLQKGDAAIQAQQPPAGMNLIDWTDELSNFADTAALVCALDLVISVDTSVAHLAGAMAKPVLLLLAKVPDWRWLEECDDCPWYPTMRLFRQVKAREWKSPVVGAATELRNLAEIKGAGKP